MKKAEIGKILSGEFMRIKSRTVASISDSLRSLSPQKTKKKHLIVNFFVLVKFDMFTISIWQKQTGWYKLTLLQGNRQVHVLMKG